MIILLYPLFDFPYFFLSYHKKFLPPLLFLLVFCAHSCKIDFVLQAFVLSLKSLYKLFLPCLTLLLTNGLRRILVFHLWFFIVWDGSFTPFLFLNSCNISTSGYNFSYFFIFFSIIGYFSSVFSCKVIIGSSGDSSDCFCLKHTFELDWIIDTIVFN